MVDSYPVGVLLPPVYPGGVYGATPRVYGSPGSEYMPVPLATAIASPSGRFHTSFLVTCALVVIRLHPPAHCSLGNTNPVRLVIIGGFADASFSHKLTAALGFAVTAYPPTG